jgi:hypothetical protein
MKKCTSRIRERFLVVVWTYRTQESDWIVGEAYRDVVEGRQREIGGEGGGGKKTAVSSVYDLITFPILSFRLEIKTLLNAPAINKLIKDNLG